MRPFYFEARNEQEVDIHIYGSIGWDETMWGDGTDNTAYSLVSLIKRLDKNYSRINVHINSPGGIIDDGLAIYNTLKQAKAAIHTYNSGMTASMASILMLAGTSHFPKTSIFHLHSASTITMGNIKEHEATIAALKVYESTLKQAIADKTGMTLEDIDQKWFDGNEHYMTAEQAAEFGFVDVMEEGKVKAPAAIDKLEKMKFAQVLQLYKNVKGTKEEKGFLEKVKSLFIEPVNNQKSDKMGNKLVFRAKLTILLALIGLQEFTLNADNKIEMNLDDAYKINDALESKDGEINSLKVENGALREEQERLQQKISELQGKLDGTPQKPATPPGIDNSKPKDEEPVTELSPEVSKALQDYNRSKGIVK